MRSSPASSPGAAGGQHHAALAAWLTRRAGRARACSAASAAASSAASAALALRRRDQRASSCTSALPAISASRAARSSAVSRPVLRGPQHVLELQPVLVLPCAYLSFLAATECVVSVHAHPQHALQHSHRTALSYNGRHSALLTGQTTMLGTPDDTAATATSEGSSACCTRSGSRTA